MKLSKIFKTATLGLVATALVACGNNNSQSGESKTTTAEKSEDNTFTLAEFRDAHATSRKYAMAVLEYLDKKKITKLVGDRRVLL